MRQSLIVIFLLWVVTVIGAQETATPERDYLLTVPFSDAHSDAPLPLIIALHGFGDTPQNFARATGFERLSEQMRFMVAYPQGVLNQWNDGSRGDHYEDDVAYFQTMIDEIAAEYPLDRDRVYLVGFSNGGSMVYRAACDAPDVFAGIAAIGGTMRNRQTCETDAALPVLMLHGTGDMVVSHEGNADRYSVDEAFALWVDLNQCDADAIEQFQSDHQRYRINFNYATACPDGNHVLMYVIDDLPHTWPGAYEYARGQRPQGRFDTARLIWSFFMQADRAAAQVEVTPAPDAD